MKGVDIQNGTRTIKASRENSLREWNVKAVDKWLIAFGILTLVLVSVLFGAEMVQFIQKHYPGTVTVQVFEEPRLPWRRGTKFENKEGSFPYYVHEDLIRETARSLHRDIAVS